MSITGACRVRHISTSTIQAKKSFVVGFFLERLHGRYTISRLLLWRWEDSPLFVGTTQRGNHAVGLVTSTSSCEGAFPTLHVGIRMAVGISSVSSTLDAIRVCRGGCNCLRSFWVWNGIRGSLLGWNQGCGGVSGFTPSSRLGRPTDRSRWNIPFLCFSRPAFRLVRTRTLSLSCPRIGPYANPFPIPVF